MQNFNLRSSILQRSALHLVVAGFVATVVPVRSAVAATYSSTYRAKPEDYEACASGVIGAGASSEQAAEACAGALYPEDLSICVSEIAGDAGINAVDALNGCRRVRRPVDLASCVVDINSAASEGTVALNVLDFCRRSLLPLRFSACVVGLRNEISFSTAEAMTDCIAASRRPRDVLPSFVPIDQGIPSTPSLITPSEDVEPRLEPFPSDQPPLSR